MDLSQGGFFKVYLKALSAKQLTALDTWQADRLADNPSKETVADAIEKKHLIHLERRRRDTGGE
jgi:hypothetical protein